MTEPRTLEEFVASYQRQKAHKPTEKELQAILDCSENRPITLLPDGSIAVLGEDLEFAQALLEWVRKEVEKENKREYGTYGGRAEMAEGWNQRNQEINVAFDRLAGKGKK